MMDTKSFDDIRAYYDSEIPEAMERIANDPMLIPAIRFVFPDKDTEHIREKIRSCKTTDQIQRGIMYPAIRRIIETSISKLTCTGVERNPSTGARLYVSNHRDITVDALVLQYVLFERNLPTTDISLGDNLLRPQLVADICRTNKMVKIIRKDDVTAREFLENSRHLAEYIRLRIGIGRSMWIAQRNGRTKDGCDATDQGLLKMLGMSGCGDFLKDFGELNITPVSISYQYEPCDILKALELCRKRHSDGPYRKHENEDFESIMTGIVSPKGNVNLAVCDTLEQEELAAMAQLPKSEAYKALVDAIDRRIVSHYMLHDTNYIACDILSGRRDWADRYTPEQEAAFRARLAAAEQKFAGAGDVDAAEAREIFLKIYANPVAAKQRLAE